MKTNRTTLVIAALALLFLGGMYYLYTQMKEAGDMWPFENEPGSLTAAIGNLNREIANLNTEIRKIPAAREQLAAIKVEYDLATRVLPRESSPDQLIAAIRTKAMQSGVVPDRLTPAVVRSGSSQSGARGRGQARGASAAFEEWSFTLQIRGSYDQIATFVNRMEEFESNDPSRTGSEKRFFQVSNIDVTAEENGMSFLIPPDAVDRDAKKGHACTLVMQTYRYTGSE